jgi:phosphate-selective porin OprO/OprP
VGKFKPPIGLERRQSDNDISFVERGLRTLLVPQRDIGFQVSGDVIRSCADYAIGVSNGIAEGSLSDTAVSNHRDYASRIFLPPFLPGEKSPLEGLGVGIGVSQGNVDSEELPSFRAFGQNAFFTFAPGVTEAHHHTRLQPQLYYYPT